MSTLKASPEFVEAVKASWHANQGAIIPITIIELEKHSEELGILGGDDEEQNLKDAEEIGTTIFDIMMACNTPEGYILAIEKEFLNPTFN